MAIDYSDTTYYTYLNTVKINYTIKHNENKKFK